MFFLFLILSITDAFIAPKNIFANRLQATTTYVPIELSSGSLTKKNTLLVKSDQEGILQELQVWKDSNVFDEEKLTLWTNEGRAFLLDNQGTQSLYHAETQSASQVHTFKKTKSLSTNIDFYVNVASPKSKTQALVKASKAADVIAGRREFAQLERQGEGFSNMTELFIDYNITTRADGIATRIRKEFPIASPEWERWTNKTSQYNATSLTHVVSEYFASHSIGDVGGVNADYITKRGFPGTLAPGEMFFENNPFNELSKKILHPWPAMQEIQFHVRMPPNHPMIPPPLLWFGLNNMYTENFAKHQLSLPSEETVGGMMMHPKDAIRIARDHKIGMSYNPDEQVRHGGMIFKTGREIPHYHPDHGPTYDVEEAKPPVPVELLPITERWLDPHFGLVSTALTETVVKSSVEQLEIEEEDALRQAAGERLFSFLPNTLRLLEEIAEEKRLDEEDLEARRIKKMQKLSAHLDDFEERVEGMEAAAAEPEANQFDRRTQRMQDQVAAGFARDPCTLIDYTIEVIRDMMDEIAIAEKDMAAKKKAGRRRQRKDRSGGAVASADADPVVDAVPFEEEIVDAFETETDVDASPAEDLVDAGEL